MNISFTIFNMSIFKYSVKPNYLTAMKIYKNYKVYIGQFLLIAALIGLCYSCQDSKNSKNQDQATNAESFKIKARKQVNNGEKWENQFANLSWKPEETAIIICDMWDRHWCDSATARVKQMAPKINKMVKMARKKGVHIVHAPSSTMDFYKDHPARKKALAQTYLEPPIPLDYWFYPDETREPPLPIDDSDEGCDSAGDPSESKITRQIKTIEIFNEDMISDSGQEMYNYFENVGVKNIVLCGVHTNMCVLGRTFGIRGQVKLGRNVVLVRDLTDAMYNPEMPPYVSHDAGTALVIKHIEKYWAPSIEWKDLFD